MKSAYPLLVLLAVALGACGKSGQPPATAEKKPGGSSSMPSLAAESPAPAAGSATATATPSGVMPPPPPIDFATVARTSVGHGPVTSDLDILNHALERYSNAAPPPGAPLSVEGKPPITDLSQLVKAGIIKALPTPPAGKQFAIDPKSGQAVLIDKK